MDTSDIIALIISILALSVAIWAAYEARQSRLINKNENIGNNFVELVFEQRSPLYVIYRVKNISTKHSVYMEYIEFRGEKIDCHNEVIPKGEEGIFGFKESANQEENMIFYFRDGIGRKFQKIIHIIPGKYHHNTSEFISDPSVLLSLPSAIA